MYYDYTQEELRTYCRNYIETLEIWARRLVHEKMVAEYGPDYLNKQVAKDEYLVKREIRNHVKTMMEKEPSRFRRPVDTLFIEQIIYFLCNPKWYNKLFKQALDYIYPQGKDEAREFLNRLVPIRNPLSHANPISMHDVERAICYSHDFIAGLKAYYKDRGEEAVWNVPRIIRIKDSLGNVFEPSLDEQGMQSVFLVENTINCGDTYSVEIEIDGSFKKEDYFIRWRFNLHDTSQNDDKQKITITFGPTDVSARTFIFCEIISKEDWHKHRTYDDEVAIGLSILPPVK